VWSWHPLLVLSLAEARSARPGFERAIQSVMRRWQKEFVTGESTKETVKTIAWGMPDVSGASAVNTRVHTSTTERTRGCGCIGHPAFPAPSFVMRATNEASPRGEHRLRASSFACKGLPVAFDRQRGISRLEFGFRKPKGRPEAAFKESFAADVVGFRSPFRPCRHRRRPASRAVRPSATRRPSPLWSPEVRPPKRRPAARCGPPWRGR
jgi:hypothetical protein